MSDKILELTNQWNSHLESEFQKRISCGDSPDEALKEARRLTKLHFATPDPKGEWDGDLGAYDPPKNKIEYIDL